MKKKRTRKIFWSTRATFDLGYCTGIKRSATPGPNLAKHPDGGVPLGADDKRALVAFLKTLTDEKYLPSVVPQNLAAKYFQKSFRLHLRLRWLRVN